MQDQIASTVETPIKQQQPPPPPPPPPPIHAYISI
jgi:hypothetical protein